MPGAHGCRHHGGIPSAGDGAGLLGPITRGEVVAALIGLKNYKATGYSGCPTQLLKYAIMRIGLGSLCQLMLMLLPCWLICWMLAFNVGRFPLRGTVCLSRPFSSGVIGEIMPITVR